MSSSKPSSPKRRRIRNDVLVPSVNDTFSETLKSKHKHDTRETNVLKSKDSNTVGNLENNEYSSRKFNNNTSWATKFLQSIGLDKQSSISKRRISRKIASQKVLSEGSSNSSIPCEKSNLKCITKPKNKINNQLQNKAVIENNIIKYKCNTKNKKQHVLEDNSKEYKSSKCESTKSVVGKNDICVQNKKNVKVSKCKNKNMDDVNKKKTDKKSDSNKRLISHSTSHRHSLDKKPEEGNSKSSYNNRRSPSKAEKSNIKSVVIKHTQGQIKGKWQEQLQGTKSAGCDGDQYKLSRKYKGQISTTSDITSMKNSIKVTKKYNINNLNEDAKMKHNVKSINSKVNQNGTETRKTKPKRNITKNNTVAKSTKETIKSSIKKIVPKSKSYRKIKLVINIICNKSCDELTNKESNNDTTICTIPGRDLDFLDDLNIDEIVKSLDSCEKKSNIKVNSDQRLNKCPINETLECSGKNLKSSTCIDYNNTQNDAMDLINILKGEEDDDLTKMSIENGKSFLLNNDLHILPQSNADSIMLKNVSNDRDNMSDNPLTIPINVEVKNKIYNTVETEVCSVATDIKYAAVRSKDDIIQVDATYNFTRDEKEKRDNMSDNPLTVPINIEEKIYIYDTVETELCSVATDIKYAAVPSKDDIIQVDATYNLTRDEKEKHETMVKSSVRDSMCNTSMSLTNISSEIKLLETLRVELEDSKDKCYLQGEQKTNALMFCIDSLPGTNPSTVEQKNINSKLQIIETTNNTIEAFTNEMITRNGAQNIYEQKLVIFNYEYDKTDHSKPTITDININNSEGYKVNSSTNQTNDPEHNNTDETTAENSGQSKKLQLTKDIPNDEAKSPNRSIQTNIIVKNIPIENSNKLKEYAVTDLKCKLDRVTAQKLEERLYTCSGSKYSINRIIRNGKYSKIFKCTHPNGKDYALKMLTTNVCYHSGKEKKKMLDSLICDIPKNNLFIVDVTNAFNMTGKWCFLMEYYPKNLREVLTELGKPFPIEDIQDYARQLVIAVMVLRNNNMVHLDIKPQHILMNSSCKMLKLCGFDNLSYINKMKILPNVGTANYRAPEVILGYRASFEIDVWSTGLVLYEMAANRKLFTGIYNNEILFKQMSILGCVPYDMIKRSRFSGVHFIGTKFMRKFGFKGQNVNIISKFYKSNTLCDSIYNTYFENWGLHRTISQQNSDIGKLSLFVKLLQKMLKIHPESRLPIEFVYANPFIYDAYAYQEW